MNGHEIGERSLAADTLKQDLCCCAAHLVKGLANRGQTRIMEGCTLNVVESHDGNIRGNLQAMIDQGANSANGGDVVVADKCSEVTAALNQLVCGLESEFGR